MLEGLGGACAACGLAGFLRAAARISAPAPVRRAAPPDSLKCRPRASKSWYWSKLVQAGESSTTSPGRAAARGRRDRALEVAAAQLAGADRRAGSPASSPIR